MAIEVEENKQLKELTTFKIGGPARFFAVVKSPEEFKEALIFAKEKGVGIFVLGGGSNMLISDAGLDNLVLHFAQKGIEVLSEDDSTPTVQIKAGENWDDVVDYAVRQGWWGIENLSHIPGTAGGAIVQNIGAYGQQLSDVLLECEAVDLQSGASKVFRSGEFDFDYRASIFNTSRKGEFAVVSITVKLTKKAPVLAASGEHPNLKYPDVQKYFAERNISEPSLAQIREAIITIRDSKYPFPREEVGGNAGSFFKNLLLSEDEYARLAENVSKNFGADVLARLEEIKNKFAQAPSTTRRRGQIKIPTAFLLDVCGLKGTQVGGVKINEKQPLVLLNAGGAKAQDVLDTISKVRRTIYEKTGMEIKIEPELVGFSEEDLQRVFSLA